MNEEAVLAVTKIRKGRDRQKRQRLKSIAFILHVGNDK
jgi:hypothetical protein